MDSQITELEISAIIDTHDLRARLEVDPQTVATYAEAMEAGAIFPPLRVCKTTLRLIDGYHRLAAYKRRGTTTVKVQYESVESDADFFLRAVASNATHGLHYNSFDYGQIGARAEALGITTTVLAGVLKVDPIRLGDVKPMKAVGIPQKTVQRPLKLAESHRVIRSSQLTVAEKSWRTGIRPIAGDSADNPPSESVVLSKAIDGLQLIEDSLCYFPEFLGYVDELIAIRERLEKEAKRDRKTEMKPLLLIAETEHDLELKRDRAERDGYEAIGGIQYNTETDEYYIRMTKTSELATA